MPAPTQFVKTANIVDGAVRLTSLEILGRVVRLTGYPLSLAGNVYVGYDNTVSASNFAFALRGGDLVTDESSSTRDRRNPAIFWFAVDTDGAGLACGVE